MYSILLLLVVVVVAVVVVVVVVVVYCDDLNVNICSYDLICHRQCIVMLYNLSSAAGLHISLSTPKGKT